MSANTPTALIAEDEPLLAQALAVDLQRVWPTLRIVATVGDGTTAVASALTHTPDVLFFDVRMPGMNGLDAAAELADRWHQGPAAKPFPQLVFVTAFDEYAVQAFEAQAVDYLLKPVQMTRLQKTVEKLQRSLVNPADSEHSLQTTVDQLRSLLSAPPTPRLTPLQVIQASVGTTLHMVAVADVLCFEAADKYVRVLTAQREYLIRTPLRELMAQLDTQRFWQIHRGTLVQATAIESVTRDEAGKLHVQVRGLVERFVVSRLYAHLFKAM